MNPLRCGLILFAALLASPARGAGLPPPVAEALAKAGISQAHVGVYVQRLDARRPLVALNDQAALNPGSTMKLVTTYAALNLLGPAYTWHTDLLATAPLRDGVLDGDLYVKGYGDPDLTLENFWLLLRELRARGVREIRGGLVLDDSYFSVQGDAAAFDGKPERPYNVVPSALLVNFNSLRLRYTADPAGHGVRISTEPALPEVTVASSIVLDDAPCGDDWANRLTLDTAGDPARAMTLRFSGAFSAACAEKERSYAALTTPRYTYALFSLLWRELGGSLRGDVRSGAVPDNARVIATTNSPPLAQVIRDINKFSNNVMAREVFLTLGAADVNVPAAAAGAPNDPAKAEQAVRRWLMTRGLQFPELVLENGAGLSRNERISARSLAALLQDAWASPVMPELAASLPLLGTDGTLKRRLAGQAAAGQGHLKTGLLDGVRALAGYMRDAQGRPVVVVFLVNDEHSDGAAAAQDALLTWIHSQNK